MATKKMTKKKPAKASKVTIYFTETCPWCHKTMEWLKQHNIPYVGKNVGEDQKALDDMIKKSNQMGVPVIDINGTIVIGFNEAKLKQLLL